MLMKRAGVLLFFGLLFFSLVSAGPIDSKVGEITHYAEDYETGNIDYAQLLVYMARAREELNVELGATPQEGEHDITFRAEEIENAFGKPTEETKWIWVEKEDREKKLDEEIPAWRKLIFDGNKIQFSINAWPNILVKKDGSEIIIYRLNMEVRFKQPQENLDIKGEIEQIKILAEEFNANPTNENKERLAEESVSAEQKFRNYMEQSASQCLDVMNDVIGSENKKNDRKIVVNEIEFFEGDDFVVNARLEMCDEGCDWNWVSVNFWTERRGPQNKGENEIGDASGEKYKGLGVDELKNKLSEAIEDYKEALRSDDDTKEIRERILALNWAWDDAGNNIWQEVEAIFKQKKDSLTPEQMRDYDWEKENEERTVFEKELRNKNYEDRKSFYADLFSSYKKKEFFFSEIEYERFLIQNIVENKQEFCSNDVDDNDDKQIDCADNQCGGQLCGQETIEVIGEESQTKNFTRDLFCVEGMCKARDEMMLKESVCGNNICEEGEGELCAQDCLSCAKHNALACDGSVIFSGINLQGCNLAPICVVETQTCQSNEECVQPLCGTAECVEGICQTTQITECRESECISSETRTQRCADGSELSVEICDEGLWRKTGVECESILDEMEVDGEIVPEQLVGEECSARGDCGGENDVCSNGKCITLPSVVEEETQNEVFWTSPQREDEQESEFPEASENSESVEPQAGVIGLVITFLQNTITPETGQTNPEVNGGENTGEGNNLQGENGGQAPETETIREGEDKEIGLSPKDSDRGVHELGAFRVGGSCREGQEKEEGFVYFDGWGEPFGDFHKIKQKYYSQGGTDWCEIDMENLIRQRRELEKGLNEEFAKWFFEKYLANSAEEWEAYVSGIYEIYWRVVDLSKQIAERSNCLETEFTDYNLINFEYSTEYGMIKFWEEITENAQVFGEDSEGATVASPYMQIWIFPPMEFIIKEMQKAMKNHEFPGSPEEKLERENENGLTEEEKADIREDEGFMSQFNEILESYGGDVSATLQLVNYETDEIVFNIFIEMNNEDIMKMTPMLPEEVTEKDIEIKVDFEKVFEMIQQGEQGTREIRIESPPWDKNKRPVQKIKEIVNGIEMWFKMRALINSAEVFPAESEDDVKDFGKEVLFRILSDDDRRDEEQMDEEDDLGEEKGVWEDDKTITGEVVI